MFENYIDSISVGLMNLNVGIDAPLAMLLAKIAVYAFFVYVVTAAIVLLGRITRLIRIVNPIGTKAVSAGCALFIFLSVLSLYLMRDYFVRILALFQPQVISYLFRNPGQAFLIVLLLAVLVVCLLALCWVLYACVIGCHDLISRNLQANGALTGILLSCYELLSGIAWLAAFICAMGMGFVIFFIPFFFAASLARRDKRYYD
ncbi:MAG TPA: hypothetical protein H9735_05355 [Candidatus Anaerostipes excrementavium]|uniref:Uncharacterized protein n=1 Tax=Candidatus Anaerostipes excrementavium TaxID=2838463 RepID=A0A9D1WUP1_9FIRM|nr:hypothetical protein [uncultured Anaerostipes sp.]HIX67539.1 hypothetical protein [Candidatus Anaerostipes excrementavium]